MACQKLHIKTFYPTLKVVKGGIYDQQNSGVDVYTYGFNGMEKDDEIKNVEGSSYDFGARIYDSRIGRFLSLDAYASKFPNQSPYVFAGNTPVAAIDINGDSIRIISSNIDATKQICDDLALKLGSGYTVEYKKVEQQTKIMGDSNNDGSPNITTQSYFLVTIVKENNAAESELYNELNEYSTSQKDLDIALPDAWILRGQKSNQLFTGQIATQKISRYKPNDIDRPVDMNPGKIQIFEIDKRSTVLFSWGFSKEIEQMSGVKGIDQLLFSCGINSNNEIINISQKSITSSDVALPNTLSKVFIETENKTVDVRCTSDKGNVFTIKDKATKEKSKGNKKVNNE